MLEITNQEVTGNQLDLDADSNGAVFVRWGDGSADEAATAVIPPTDAGVLGKYSATHTYAKPGWYDVEVRNNENRIARRIDVSYVMPASKFSAQLAAQEAAEEELAGSASITGQLDG